MALEVYRLDSTIAPLNRGPLWTPTFAPSLKSRPDRLAMGIHTDRSLGRVRNDGLPIEDRVPEHALVAAI